MAAEKTPLEYLFEHEQADIGSKNSADHGASATAKGGGGVGYGWDDTVVTQDRSTKTKNENKNKTTDNASGEARDEVAAMQKAAPLLEAIQSDTGESGHPSGSYVAFHLCPVCGHRDCFRYYTESNTWTCFSASNASGYSGGGYLEYQKAAHQMSDVEAMRRLREATGHPYEDRAGKAGQDAGSIGAPGRNANANGTQNDSQESDGCVFENAADVVGTPYEFVPSLCEGLIDLEDVVEVVGEGGLGKSWFLIGCGIATAVGGEFAGLQFNLGKVLFVNPEIQKPKFRNRLRRVLNDLGVSYNEIGRRFEFKTFRGDETNISNITTMIAGGGYSLVCLDSLYMLHDEDENDARSMKHVIMAMITAGKESGATVMTTHHTGKGASGAKRAVDRARGSSVLHGGPDVMLTLDELSVEEGSGAWELLSAYNRRGESGNMIFAKPVRLTFAKVRDHEDRPPINLIFRWPTFVVDETGELDECNIVGSAADLASKAAKEKAKKSHDVADAQAMALDEIIAELEAQGTMPTRANCLPLFNEAREAMGLDPIVKDTFATYTRNGGILPHRVRPDSSNALWRPQFDAEEAEQISQDKP